VARIDRTAALAGQVSPKGLLQLYQAGVELYSNSALHAKVYVFPKAAVVGSANLSSSSRYRLHEACVLLRDPALVAQARAFVQVMAKESPSIGPAILEKLPEREPKGFPMVAPSRRVRSSEPSGGQPRLFVASTVAAEFEPELERQAQETRAEARKRSKSRLSFSTIHWPTDPKIQVGDTILVREDDDERDVRIEAPGVVFAVRQLTKGGVLVAYASDPRQQRRTSRRFKQVVGKEAAKVVLGRESTFRLVGRRHVAALLSPWKPWSAPLKQ
jgi:hypothetical protein